MKKILFVLFMIFVSACASTYEKNKPQEITVRVRDFDSKMPLKNAKIMETRAYAPEFSEKDARDRAIGLTDANGAFYTDEFNPEHVLRFGASADGYHGEWLDIDSFNPGGNYEFELKRKSGF